MTTATMQIPTLAPSCELVSTPALGNSSRLSLIRISGTQSLALNAIRYAKISNAHRLVSRRQHVVYAEYSGRRSGGAGDFVAGFLLGGVLCGAIGYLMAPTITKSIAAAETDTQEDEVEGPPKKLPKFVEDDDEGLEQNTRRSLNEKIAQLNAAIDDVSAQLRADDGTFGGINESAVELESAA